MSYASEVLADSPLVYYRLGETSGTTATDSAGNQNGTYQATKSSNAGLIASDPTDGSLLGATGQGVKATNNTLFDQIRTAGKWTLECWVKADSGSLSSRRELINRFGSDALWWNLQNNGKQNLYMAGLTGGSYKQSSGAVSEGAITHLAATWDGTTLTFYFNGVADPSTYSVSGTMAASTSAVEIAYNEVGGNPPFLGSFDEAAVYKTALSASRIAAHYAAAQAQANTVKSLAAMGVG